MIDVGFVRAVGAGVAEAIFRLVAFGDSQGALSILENISAAFSSAGGGPAPSPDPGATREDGSLWTIQTWFLDRGLDAAEGPDGPLPADYVWGQDGDSWVWRPVT
jgi:hypothetical protein